MLRTLEHHFRNTPCEFEGWRNYNNAVKVIRAYNSHYPKEDFEVVRNPLTGLPYVEQPFSVDTHYIIRGRKLIYTGKIDLKLQFQDKSKYTMDHKTTTKMGDTFWLEQQMTGQHRGYVWADRECTGEECTGYIVNALGIRESLENSWYDETLEQIVVPPKSKAIPFEPSRQRFFTRIPPGQLDEWFFNMLAQVDRFLYNVDNNTFPRHHVHCINKYGKCKFFNVCSLPEESRESALMSGAYTENDWSPLYS